MCFVAVYPRVCVLIQTCIRMSTLHRRLQHTNQNKNREKPPGAADDPNYQPHDGHPLILLATLLAAIAGVCACVCVCVPWDWWWVLLWFSS